MPTNVHPVDELATIREGMKIMERREDELRALLLMEGADLRGDQHQAIIVPTSRVTVDKAALIAELGEKIAKRFMKTSSYKVLKLAPLPERTDECPPDKTTGATPKS